MKKNIKAVFLDWNGTLCDSVFWGHLDGTDQQDFFNKVRDSLFTKFIDDIKPWMRGEIRTEDILKKVADDTGLNYMLIFEEFKKGCELMILADSKVVDIVNQLKKKGIKCVISTDNMDSFTRWTAPKLSLYEIFDEILSSADLKILKRDKNKDSKSLFLEDYLYRNGLNYSECMMIDDGEDKGNVMSDSGVEYHKIESSLEVRGILKGLLSRLT